MEEVPKHKENSTEELILKAAKLVFSRKGMAGARMQEIADEAGINKALLHYYFRSKENLFNAVFYDLLGNIQKKFLGILNSEMDLFSKIRNFFTGYTDFLQENSFLPGFIINELNQDPEKMINHFRDAGIKPPPKLILQIKEEVQKGNIIQIDPMQLLMNMLSLAIFPVLAAPLLKGILEAKEGDFDQLMEKRKRELPEWFINSIMKK